MGGRGEYLVSFVLFVSFFNFLRGTCNFDLLVSWVRDSSSASQSMTYISIHWLILVSWEGRRVWV